MTEPELPRRPERARWPSTWTPCPRCGVAVVDLPVHLHYHDVIEDRIARARAAIRALNDRVAALEAIVTPPIP